MASCERCWGEAFVRGIGYSEMTEVAQREGHPCTRPDLEGARLRAGQFWNEATQSDRRADSQSAVDAAPRTEGDDT